MNKLGKLFIVAAPSGAGKTTLVNLVLPKLQNSYSIERVITYTSKTPRLNEINGKDYHFITEAEFKIKIDEGYFLEWSCAYGNYYGSPRHIIKELNDGKSFIIVLDRSGAKSVKAKFSESILIWIDVSIEELENRLINRASDSLESIKKRLELAKSEMLDEKNERFFQHYIINQQLNLALESFERLLLDELKAINL